MNPDEVSGLTSPSRGCWILRNRSVRHHRDGDEDQVPPLRRSARQVQTVFVDDMDAMANGRDQSGHNRQGPSNLYSGAGQFFPFTKEKPSLVISNGLMIGS